MSNTKFKSGDKVVFCKSSLASGMIDAKEGDVFTVSEFSEEHWGDVVRLEGVKGVISTSHIEHYVEKEKVMEKYIPKVGDKVKGFKFDDDSYPSIGYNESMDDVVGQQGTVQCVYEDRFEIGFGDNWWAYPLELAHLAKIEEPSKFEDSSQEISHEDSQIDWQGSQINWQVGQVVWDVVYGKGEVVNVLQNVLKYPVVVKFVDGKRHFTEDGKTDQEFARTLFFSEPVITAELFPPKKHFVPTLKKRDKILIRIKSGIYPEGVVREVFSEVEDRVYISEDGHYFMKYDIESIRILGEEIKFQ